MLNKSVEGSEPIKATNNNNGMECGYTKIIRTFHCNSCKVYVHLPLTQTRVEASCVWKDCYSEHIALHTQSMQNLIEIWTGAAVWSESEGERLWTEAEGERLWSEAEGERPWSVAEGERLWTEAEGERPWSVAEGERLWTEAEGERLWTEAEHWMWTSLLRRISFWEVVVWYVS